MNIKLYTYIVLMILCFCRVYPYILIVSAIFMLITIVIYTAYPKLLNHYSRLMRQYSFSMMLAFSFLAIIQLKAKDEINVGLCIFFGRLSFFLNSLIQAYFFALSCSLPIILCSTTYLE